MFRYKTDFERRDFVLYQKYKLYCYWVAGVLQIKNAMEDMKYYFQANCPHNYGMISANNPTYICSVLKKGLNKRATAPPKECRLGV